MRWRIAFVVALGWTFASLATPLGANDLVVSQNTTQHADLTGNVIVRNGATLTVVDAVISGNVLIEQGGSFVGSGVHITGNLTALDAESVVLQNSAARPSDVARDLWLCRMSGGQEILGARIGGRVLIEDSAAAEIVLQDCVVDGDVQLFGNDVANAFLVQDNLIQGSLQWGWSSDTPQTAGNSVSGGIASGSEIEILAKGYSGGESLELQIDQRTVCHWNVDTSFRRYRFRCNEPAAADRIRAASATEPGGTDDLNNGLVVDWIGIDGNVHQTEDPSVFARGVAVLGMPARPGFYKTESLSFDGFFQFGITGAEDALLLLDLNAALPDGWKFSLFNDKKHIRLRTYDTAGKKAFYSRFGSTGVISSIQDSRSNKQLVAPPFKKENTDRVLQWTVWETGPTVVHDVSSLPWYEDRFNVTQAGTFRNVYQGTVEVIMDSQQGQLDVWSVHDRQWKSELEPYIKGSLSALTRTNVLDGGGMLVRRVIRIGEVTLHGNPVTLSSPLFEAWSPFADKVFDSMALDLDSQGNPTWWYADSKNIPMYPYWPVASTRGWAIVYDRDKKSSGPIVAVVFGRDRGVVVLGDGSTTLPERYDLNSMDFKGGLAILPGYWPGSFPKGSMVDLSFIFLPAHGIRSTTAGMLDDLASRLPPPRAYLPGAPMSGELSIIADRLSTLENEKKTRTDELGKVK